MHFWIDKRSQGCGFSGRYRVPPSLSGSRRSDRYQFHSKVMVTPVHRFQSIESVATNGLRHPRAAPSYHSRYPSSHYNSANVIRHPNILLTAANASNHHTATPRRANAPMARLKCGVWAFFAIITFFLTGAKYYFHGVNMGMEVLAFCSLLAGILIVGGLLSLCDALTSSSSSSTASSNNNNVVNAADQTNTIQNTPDQLVQEISDDFQSQVPSPIVTTAVAELPPPPYHIAIMLPTQQEQSHSIRIIQDSPPPSYDKAVT